MNTNALLVGRRAPSHLYMQPYPTKYTSPVAKTMIIPGEQCSATPFLLSSNVITRYHAVFLSLVAARNIGPEIPHIHQQTTRSCIEPCITEPPTTLTVLVLHAYVDLTVSCHLPRSRVLTVKIHPPCSTSPTVRWTHRVYIHTTHTPTIHEVLAEHRTMSRMLCVYILRQIH